jgi:hypothetical protein
MTEPVNKIEQYLLKMIARGDQTTGLRANNVNLAVDLARNILLSPDLHKACIDAIGGIVIALQYDGQYEAARYMIEGASQMMIDLLVDTDGPEKT